MKPEMKRYEQLFQELSTYEREGVYLAMEGNPASPTQIVKAHMMREDIAYMRDYIWDEKGDLKKLHFYQIEDKN